MSSYSVCSTNESSAAKAGAWEYSFPATSRMCAPS